MSRPPTRKTSPELHKSEAVRLKRGVVSDPGLGVWAKVAALGSSAEFVSHVRERDGHPDLVLLAGPAGSGKAKTAAAIAQDLGRSLHRLDLGAIVSRHIGETEKALEAAFDAAEAAGAVLLFDEADALFGKRSQVRDAHDRYANIDVNYLLARLERFDGLVIVTSNDKAALDPAFLRRLRHVISFPLSKRR